MSSPRPEQAIVFTIARMNPPTSGHMYVIQSLLEKARDLQQSKIYLLLSKTTGEKTDPLRCGEKRDFLLSGMITKVKEHTPGTEEIEVVILCGDDELAPECNNRWITSQLCHIMRDYNTDIQLNLYLIVGSDRVEDEAGQPIPGYNWISGVFSKSNKPIQLSIIGLPRPRGAISATYIRGLVTDDKKDEFITKETDAGLSLEKAEELYDTLAERLSALDMPSKKRKKETTLTAANSTTSRMANSTARVVSKRTKTTMGGKKKRKTYKKTRKYKK